MVREFISGWDLMQILGEGTFAEVKLLVNRESGEACAMKEIDLSTHPDAAEAVKKEICVHKLLCHQNVVRCYGSRIEAERQFIFLEYCAGGELFDRIEPEHGMPEHSAQYFFRQLIEGLSYLHARGIAHRDIKPENLLISDAEVLKISDFGMATVFRHRGKERLLERRCGTMPYIAPEVLMRPTYRAEPADIWSAGMVLMAMVTGELPWDRPTPDQHHFVTWKDNDHQKQPWRRIDSLPLSLLRKILNVSAGKRCSIEYVRAHLWYKKRFKDNEGNLLEPELVSPPLKRCYVGGDFICQSQPQEMFDAKASEAEAAASRTHPTDESTHFKLPSTRLSQLRSPHLLHEEEEAHENKQDEENDDEEEEDAKQRPNIFIQTHIADAKEDEIVDELVRENEAAAAAAAAASAATVAAAAGNGCEGDDAGDGRAVAARHRAKAVAAAAAAAIAEKKVDSLHHFGSFSQPALMANYYTGTQQSTQQTQNGPQSIYQRLVKRMTRFWVVINFDQADAFLKPVLKKLGYKVGSAAKGLYTIETTDRRGTVLLIKCTFICVEGKVLVDFRLSRGCGLEFKKHFALIKTNCRDILDKAPILWPALIPIDALPELPDD